MIDHLSLVHVLIFLHASRTYELVDYEPYLTSPDTDAPISPPANVAKQISGSDVILTWDANLASVASTYADQGHHHRSNLEVFILLYSINNIYNT